MLLVNAAAHAQAMRDAKRIEARLLAGENDVCFESPAGFMVHYRLPKWREAPLKRTRIAWLRWKAWL